MTDIDTLRWLYKAYGRHPIYSRRAKYIRWYLGEILT